MLPEDRLQMKWRESEGSSLGYLVQVKPMAGEGPVPPLLCGLAASMLLCAPLLPPSTYVCLRGATLGPGQQDNEEVA